MKFRSAAVWAACVLALPVHATPVTSAPGSVTTNVITFSAYDNVTSTVVGDTVDVGTAQNVEPVSLVFSDPSSQVILGAVNTSFGSNGSWPVSGAFAGLNAADGFMIFSFGRGLSFVGGFVNYFPGTREGGATLTALDRDNVPIDGEDEIHLDFTSSDTQGQFRGFFRDEADIWGFRLSDGFVAIDSLTFSVPADATVPEPASMALVMAALGGLVLSSRRRR